MCVFLYFYHFPQLCSDCVLCSEISDLLLFFSLCGFCLHVSASLQLSCSFILWAPAKNIHVIRSFILVDAHQRDLRSVIDSHSPVERHGWWWKILKLRGIIRDIFLCRDTKCLTDLVYLPERLCLKLLPPRSAIIYSAWLICQKHKFLESMNSS